MKVSRGVYSLIFFLLGFLIITHLFSLPVEKAPDISIPYYYDVNKSILSKSASPIDTPPVTFDYIENNGNSNRSFQIIQISKNANTTKNILIPKESSGPEYLTYADNPDFFIKYPRLGAKASFYDNNGNFLWEKINRHYVQVMPNGLNILAISGDHSRVFIKDPDLKEITNFEGMLLVDYQRIENHPERQNGADLCFAFLDGDVILYDISASTKIRFNFKGNLKSIACDGQNMTVLAHVERTFNNKIQDTLIYAKINKIESLQSYNGEANIIFEFPLPKHYNHTLPLALYDDYATILLPGKNLITALIFNRKGNVIERIHLPVRTDNHEDWRAVTLPSAVAFWSSQDLLIMKDSLTYRLHQDIINAKSQGNLLFIQTKGEIVSFNIK